MLHLYASLIPHFNPGVSDGKESTCNVGDLGSIPGLGKSPGGGHGNPLQSCLESAHGQRCLACYSPWGHRESDTTEQQRTHLCDNSWNQVVQVIWFCCPWKSYYFFSILVSFHVNIYFWVSLSQKYTKYYPKLHLIAIMLNLQINWQKTNFLGISNFPTCDHSVFLHLICLISLESVLKFSVYRFHNYLIV